MTKVDIVFSGDPHLCIDVQCPAGRNPDTFYDEQRAKLAFIKSYCEANGVKWYGIPGDLLNYKNPSLYTAASINSLMYELSNLRENLTLLAISGNHDLKMSSRDMKAKSVYNIFAEPGVITDIDKKTIFLADDVTISGIDFNPSREDLLLEVAALNAKLNPDLINILMIHEHLLPGDESMPFGEHLNYSQFLEFTNIRVIVSGHLHKGYPTETIGSYDIEADDGSGHEITFINPWSLTRVARDHYALSDDHKPELVHLTIWDGVVSFKHVEIPHKPFEVAFILDSLVSEENQELNISEFVSSLNSFSEEPVANVIALSKPEAVKEKIRFYLELAEQQLA